MIRSFGRVRTRNPYPCGIGVSFLNRVQSRVLIGVDLASAFCLVQTTLESSSVHEQMLVVRHGTKRRVVVSETMAILSGPPFDCIVFISF